MSARELSDRTGRFDFGSDLRDLFGARPDNLFMVELSYWLSR